ncbi:MAG: leucine--tRNA ligase [Methanomicrobiales archaeon]
MHEPEQDAQMASWYEAEPSAKEKFYLTVAYPYPSGAMHVGHGRTYIVPDVVARYHRMKGREVLYPMAFHVTGTPVIGISRRIAQGDPHTLHLYHDLYRVPHDVLEGFTDPMAIVRYFSTEYRRVMEACGLSIDWRRQFTTVDPHYSRFIQWQFLRLQEQGYVARGAHPVKYCLQDDNPVGDHDLLEGDAADIIQFTLVLFTMDGARIPTATLRPETTYGVTNLWVNPAITYVRARVDGEEWIVSRDAAEKLSLQDHEVEISGEIDGSALVDRTAAHPLCGEVPILPADFVDPDMGSGMVMSVPAHAPFDYVALRDLQRAGRYTEIEPIPLIAVEGFGEAPARDAVERAGITDQNDPGVETLTQEVYNAEFSRGKMLPRYGGTPVPEARNEVAERMQREFGSIVMYDFDTRPVTCRCGGRVYVRILHDQWFLRYSDPAWKEDVHRQVEDMSLVPPEVAAEFHRTVDWLKDWACTRRVGLGTPLPWDPDWIVEPLSDSTIYMAYYTIAHRIRELPVDQLTPAVFDAIFLGKPAPGTIDPRVIQELQSEFLYWYPYDYRFSAKDLISNHLTFQLFHHRAIFPDTLQPDGMVVFGMGLLNGAKMSSSKGNVYLLEDAVNEFGADTVRMFLVGSAEPWQDFDWRHELVSSTRRQIDRFSSAIREAAGASGEHPIDPWLKSRLQRRIAAVTAALDQFQTRQALQESYFGIEQDLRWYRRRLPRDARPGDAFGDLCGTWVRLMAPFIPFTCQALWEELGGDGPIARAPWPEVSPALIDPRLELGEELLMRTLEDIESILRLIQMEPSVLTIILAPEWKHQVFRTVAEAEDRAAVLKTVMQDPDMRSRGREAAGAVRSITTFIHRLPPALVDQLVQTGIDEARVFEEARQFLEQESGMRVVIETAETSSHNKAKTALPFKPALVIE